MPTRIEYSSIFDTVLPSAYFKNISLLPSNQADSRTAAYVDNDIEYDFELNQFGKRVLGKKTLAFQGAGPQGQYLMVNAEVVLKDHMRRGNRLSWLDDERFLENLKLRVLLSRDPRTTEKLQKGKFSHDFIRRARQTTKVQEQVIDLKKRSTFSKKSVKMEKIGGKSVYCVQYVFSFNIPRLNPDHLAIFAHTFYDLNAHAQMVQSPATSKRRFLQSASTGALIIKDGKNNTGGHIFVLPNGKVWAGPIHHRDETGYMAGAHHSNNPHSRLVRKRVVNQIIKDYRLLDKVYGAKMLLVPFIEKSIGGPLNKTTESLNIEQKPSYISEPTYSFDRKNHLGFVFHMNFHKIVKEHSQFGNFINLADEETKQDVYSKSRITSFKVFRNRVLPGLSPNDIIDAGYEEKTSLIAEGGERAKGRLKTRKVTRPVQPNEVKSGKAIVGHSREVDLQFGDLLGIRSFAISDYDMSKKTDGLYSYTVEFEIEDGSRRYVSKSLKKLRKIRSMFTKFHNVAQRMENYDSATGYSFSQTFKDHMAERYPIPSEKDIVNLTKKKRNQHVRSSVVRAPWLNSVATYIDILFNTTTLDKDDAQALASFLVKIASPETGDLAGQAVFIELLENLELRLSRAMGATSSTLDTMDMYSKTAVHKGSTSKKSIHVSKTFAMVHDSNTQNDVGYEFFAGTLGPSSKQVGLQALTATQMSNRLVAEHRKYYSSRLADQEQATLFKEQGPESPGNYKKYINLEDAYYTFLTPSVVRVGENFNKKILKKGPSVWSPKSYLRMAMGILGSNPSSAGKQTTPPLVTEAGYDSGRPGAGSSAYSAGLLAKVAMATSAITIRHLPPRQPVATNTSTHDADDVPIPYVHDDFLDPIDYMGELTKFASDPIEDLSLDTEPLAIEQARNTADINSALSIGLAFDDMRGKQRRPNILQLAATRADNIIDASFGSEAEKEKYFKYLPNQIKSLYLSNDTRTNKNWFSLKRNFGRDILNSPEYYGVLYTNFQHINRIEVLVGFTKDDSGEPQVSSPIYEALNKSKFDTLKKEGRTFLCQMTPYGGDPVLKLKREAKMRLPEFNKNFIIRADKISERLKRLQKREQRRLAAERLEAEGGRSAIVRELYLERLNEYPEVNSTGFEFMKRAIGTIKDINGIPPEFVRTLVIEQPRIPTKVGTSFGKLSSRRKRRRGAAGTGPATTTTPGPTGTGGY